MTEYVKTFPCPKCGIAASGRGHLCHPTREAISFKCEFCKETVTDPRHTCAAMTDNLEYICKNCGRSAPYDTLLCEPEPIDEE